MNQLYRDYRDRAAFYVVYIQEAHASDMWQLPSNIKDNVVFANPKTDEERNEAAGACVRKLGLELPAIIDNLQNTTDEAYTGWPDRLYLIGKDGRVVYKSKPGPFGFHPAELRQALERTLP